MMWRLITYLWFFYWSILMIGIAVTFQGCTFIEVNGDGNSVDANAEAPVMSNHVEYDPVEGQDDE